MAEQMRPASDEEAPDPSFNYERSHPSREPGQGRLDSDKAVPSDQPDHVATAVTNKQDPERQLNAHDVVDQRADRTPNPQQPDHSMKDEEPLGSDQVPTDIHNPREQRHPKPDGVGGTP